MKPETKQYCLIDGGRSEIRIVATLIVDTVVCLFISGLRLDELTDRHKI